MKYESSMVRAFAALSVALSAVAASPAAANGNYPERPIKIIVGFGAGGPVDAVARMLSQHLTKEFGQPVVVENKPGADTRLAMDLVKSAAPDGYTLSVVDSGLAVNALFFTERPYDPIKDFSPVFYIGDVPFLIATSQKIKVSNLNEFIAYAKANPGKLNYAGTASSTALAGAMLNRVAGVDTVLVRYKGAAFGVPALISGEVDYMVTAVGGLTNLIKEGKVNGLAVTSPMRSPLLPDVPTTAEAGLSGMSYVNWYAVIGPAGMPKSIVDRLSAALKSAAAVPDVQDRMKTLGLIANAKTPEQFRAFLSEEVPKIDETIRAAKLRPE
ncbi:MAG: tripartite tricarboxylate transporter substrate binding protein [Burkholderiales bacterium]|nr:tripartite tricarboxylate transporter substrate binding protein [Burkholderiales bacterium]